MARVLVVVPVVAVVVQLVWIPAVLVCAYIRAEVVDNMGSITRISFLLSVSGL